MTRHDFAFAAMAGGAALLLTLDTGSADASPPIVNYVGLCDASASVSVTPARFVVANDEDNVLRLYEEGSANPVPGALCLDDFLDIDTRKDPEADIEGATRIADRIYWIASHGANKSGKPRPNRHRLFATDLVQRPGQIDLRPAGKPFSGLVAALSAIAVPGFDAGAAAALAPESQGGLNIEGLTRTPDEKLLIGFRNPIPDGKALLVPLDNPGDVVAGHADPVFGSPVLLDLGGRGIRSIEYSDLRKEYLIVAGAFDDSNRFALYRWSGGSADQPAEIPDIDLQGLRPEALAISPGGPRVLLLSDDGSRLAGTTPCKELDDQNARGFRAMALDIRSASGSTR